MGKEQYVVLKMCGRKHISYKVIYKVDVDNPDAIDLCWKFIHEQKCEFQYSIVRTYWVGSGYMKKYE